MTVSSSSLNVDWKSFLERADITWDFALPTNWYESAFVGNGKNLYFIIISLFFFSVHLSNLSLVFNTYAPFTHI